MWTKDRRDFALAAFVLLILSFATRMSVFGHPDLYVDEAFYFAAGVEMRHGGVPFVDIWDRKPVGHFLLFAAIARISAAPLAYQLAATLFAFATAVVVYAGTFGTVGRLGALLGSCAYLLAICLFNGHGGQSAVFYNLPVALAGVLVMREFRAGREVLGRRRIQLAMLLAGIAVTIKTTAVFEAAYFGLAAAWLASSRAGIGRPVAARIAGWAFLGALPSLAIAVWYFVNGYGDEFWTAMVTSNLRKATDGSGAFHRLGILGAIASPLLAVALVALANWPKPMRVFLCGWGIAALAGFFSVPAFYLHYALPLLVPLCIAATGFLGQRRTGPIVFALLATMALIAYPFFNFAPTVAARQGMRELVSAVKQHGSRGPLLIFDGPPLLYTLADKRFPTPLAFPNHLNEASERDVSHLSTREEVRRVLGRNPDAVVLRSKDVSNLETAALVHTYVRANCHEVASVRLGPDYAGQVEVFGDCRAGATKKPRR